MSASQSFLSGPKYGYDFVVATTQDSINSTMKEFLAKLKEPVVNVCYIADENGNPVSIKYEDLKQKANGSDPFKVPAGAYPDSDKDLQNLKNARFMAGFRAQLGLPPGYLDKDVPDLVVLGMNTAAVTFNMLCSQFDVVEFIPGGGYNPPTWTNISQPAGAAWIFQSKVDLRLSVVDPSAYSKLPKAVQDQIQNIGGDAFSIRQLLFDFANAGLSSQIPVIQGIQPGSKLYMLLQQYFLGAYFTEMLKGGQPLLGAAVTRNEISRSTLTLTNLNFEVSPLVGDNGQQIVRPTPDQQGLSTLSYLCEADGHPSLPPVPFNWNWIDPNEEGDYDGVVATNKAAFVNFFKNELVSYVEKNCFLTSVRVWLDGLKIYYQWSMSPNQSPKITYPSTGDVVLSFSHSSASKDQAGLGGDMGGMELSTSFNLDVSFAGNTITVNQHLVVWAHPWGTWGVSTQGNIVDKMITDTYTLAVDGSGKLTAKQPPNSDSVNNSKDIKVDGWGNFWGSNINTLIDDIETWVKDFTSTEFKDIPLSVVKDFVFPGGKTFAFKSVAFSDHQDLVTHITYMDPS